MNRAYNLSYQVSIHLDEPMFGMFKGQKAKLEKKYQKLLAESFRLSTINRKQSDLKAAEADEIRKRIESLESPG